MKPEVDIEPLLQLVSQVLTALGAGGLFALLALVLAQAVMLFFAPFFFYGMWRQQKRIATALENLAEAATRIDHREASAERGRVAAKKLQQAE